MDFEISVPPTQTKRNFKKRVLADENLIYKILRNQKNVKNHHYFKLKL